MAKKITWSDLWDFGDMSEVQKLIKALNSINKVYEDLEKNITTGSKAIQKSMAMTSKSLESLEKDIKSLSEVKEEDQKQIEETNKKTRALTSTYNAQKSELEKLEGQIESVTKEKEDLAAKTEEVNKLNRDAAKLSKTLAGLNTSEAKEVAKLKLQISEKRKELSQEAKVAAGRVTLYQKESARLNELRKRYKDIVLEQGNASKAARELEKEVRDLDKRLKDVDASSGQFQRNVGNYQGVFQKGGGAFKKFAAGGVAALIAGIGSAVAKSEEGAETLDNVTNDITITLAAFTRALINSFRAIGEGVNFFKAFSDSFSGLADEIEEATNKQRELSSTNFEFAAASRESREAIASQNAAIERQRIIVDNTAQSLENRLAAAEEGRRLARGQAQDELALAESIQKRAMIAVEANKSDQEALEALTEANIAVSEANANLIATTGEWDKEVQELRRDIFELDLDFLIAQQEKVAEKNISSARTLNQLSDAATDSRLAFEGLLRELPQLDALLEGTGDDVPTKTLAKQIEDAEKFADILDSVDAKAVRESLGELGLDEIEITRVLEIREAFQGLEEQVDDTGKAIREALSSEVFQTAGEAINLIGNQLFTNNQIRRDNELSAFRKQKEAELEAAGDNAQAQEAIQRQIEEKERQARIKNAKAAKNQALFNIALNTAQGVTAALTSIPPNVPLSISIGVLGALQASLVASQPLPQFEDGGLVGTNDPIITSEKGYEYAVTPSGRLIKTGNNGAEIRTDIPKGSFVIPHDISKALDKNGLNTDVIYNDSANQLQQIIRMEKDRSMDRLAAMLVRENDILAERFDKSIKNVPQTEWNISDRKLKSYLKEGNTRRSDWKSKNRF